MTGVPRTKVLELWQALAQGDLERINSEPWAIRSLARLTPLWIFPATTKWSTFASTSDGGRSWGLRTWAAPW